MEDKGLDTCEAHQDFLSKNRTWVPRDRAIILLPPDDGHLLHDFRFDAKKGQWYLWLEKVTIHRDPCVDLQHVMDEGSGSVNRWIFNKGVPRANSLLQTCEWYNISPW